MACALICALRVLALIINFCVWPNLNYSAITGLRHVRVIGGETAAVAVGVPSPWTLLGRISSLLFLAFVVDASVRLWKRGGPRDRRRAILVGGSLTLFVLLAVFQSSLVLQGIIQMPYLISLPFLIPLLVMGYQLGSDVVRSARLARELQISQTSCAPASSE